MDNNPSFNEIMFSINSLRKHFSSNNEMQIIGDKVILSKEGNTYKVSFNMIQSNGNTISMEYEVDSKKSIPSPLLAKQVLFGNVVIEEKKW